ncbi:MAG: NAD(P)H-hydrate dehydratase [Weeksellaceae bacterium]|nr:NAD(P)H-hydrate dehydratase [Weeksellaceae bacterium]
MKIFSAAQIRKCDAFTIESEPVSSLSLMERAALSCADWLSTHYAETEYFYIFCGNGNNGGDGLAIARLLYQKGFNVDVFVDKKNENFTTDARANFVAMQGISGIDIFDFAELERINIAVESVVIDALFGTGLNRKVEGKSADLILRLNKICIPKISIDIPSGLFADRLHEPDSAVFLADHTLSLQFWKKSFLHPETGFFCGKIHVRDIGLSAEFISTELSDEFVIDLSLITAIYRPRNEFSHKGNYGKTMLITGSFGKMGAAVLATHAALKAGSGITYTLAPKCGYEILQTTCPEAMYRYGGEDFINKIEVDEESVVGMGPGLGQDPETAEALLIFLLDYKKPLVLDADALNIISKSPAHLKFIPENSVITPHPREFERLFGTSENSFGRLELAKQKARDLGIFIVLKDHHTQIITPTQKVYYNVTGNSGMAKGGSGDILLGIITALLAQGYSSEQAAIFGVWLHGSAGDRAAEKHSREAMVASDLVMELGNVFSSLAKRV